MKLAFRVSRRILGGSALIAAAALLPGTAMASVAAPAAHVAHTASATARPSWWAPRCTITQTRVSLGPGDAALGTTWYALRFTNVSKRSCGMWGYPKTWAEYQDGKVIGNASRTLGGARPWIGLRPGQTAHADLGIIEAGNICSKPVTAVNLRVRAPQQVLSKVLSFKFEACHGHVTVMVVTPVHAGRND
jgi:hypothetical protein